MLKSTKRGIAGMLALAFIGMLLYQYIEIFGLSTLVVGIFVLLLLWWACGILAEWYIERRNKR